MKKTYISPKSLAIEFVSEQMLALSKVGVSNSSTTVSGGQSWSNKKEWGNSSIWNEK